MTALRTLLDQARANLTASQAPPVTLRLQFQNFIIGSGRFGDVVRADLLVTLRHGNGVWLVESATTTRWLAGEHVVEFSAGSLDAKRAAGQLIVHAAAGRVDRHYLAGGTANLRFELSQESNKLVGTYDTDRDGGLSAPARQAGIVTGSLQYEVLPPPVTFAKPEERAFGGQLTTLDGLED